MVMLHRLVQRLTRDPRSEYRANQLFGDVTWTGWDRTTALLSEIIDATLFGARAGAQQRTRYKQYAERPTPVRQVKHLCAKSVMDMGSFQSVLGGTRQ